MLESDLYLPVKDYLEKHGYRVRGEVKNCDVVATKEDDLDNVGRWKKKAKLDFQSTNIQQTEFEKYKVLQ